MSIRQWLRAVGRRLASSPGHLPPHVGLGARVRLRTGLGSSHRTFVPAGASGIVVGWNIPARQASIELDTPRTVVTVPWAWLEEEPPATSPGPPDLDAEPGVNDPAAARRGAWRRRSWRL